MRDVRREERLRILDDLNLVDGAGEASALRSVAQAETDWACPVARVDERPEGESLFTRPRAQAVRVFRRRHAGTAKDLNQDFITRLSGLRAVCPDGWSGDEAHGVHLAAFVCDARRHGEGVVHIE